jgi:hypothetical protein
MKLDLTNMEARLLRDHLAQHLKEVDDELVRTDKRELQHQLAREESKLHTILTRLEMLITQPPAEAA